MTGAALRGAARASTPPSADLISLARSLAERRVVVLGDLILDRWVATTSRGLCREAPVPVATLDASEDGLGGAANAAANLAALGCTAVLVGVVGDDAGGRSLLGTAAASGLDTSGLVVEPGRATVVKRRVLTDGQMVIRIDTGDRRPVSVQSRAALRGSLLRALRDADALLVSDYANGTMVAEVRDLLSDPRVREGRVLVVDAKDLSHYRTCRPTAVTPNFEEAMALAGGAGSGRVPGVVDPRARRVVEASGCLLAASGARTVAVTLDADGAVVLDGSSPPARVYARAGERVSTVGAGDTFAAVMTASLAAGADPVAAAELAAAASSVAVARPGTAAVTAAELLARTGAMSKHLASGDAAGWAQWHRDQGRLIAFTNGCFDILHGGHVSYLSGAKALADVLVVAVNDDDGVRRLKGSSRPVTRLADRMHVLAALSCVDAVVSFSQDSPVDLIRAVRPDVYAKGGDYRRETLPEVELVERLGGVVRILDFVEGRSSTEIIERIRDG